jgi:hypothetical protein
MLCLCHTSHNFTVDKHNRAGVHKIVLIVCSFITKSSNPYLLGCTIKILSSITTYVQRRT